MSSNFLNFFEGLKTIATALGILIGGGWAIWKFILVKETFPKLDFKVDVNFVGKQKEEWLIEILGFIENKGMVPYEISNLIFDVKYLLNTDTLQENPKYDEQIDIKNILNSKSWISSISDSKPKIYPNISMRFNYIYKVPPETSFVLVHGLLVYSNGHEMRADKLIKVPQ